MIPLQVRFCVFHRPFTPRHERVLFCLTFLDLHTPRHPLRTSFTSVSLRLLELYRGLSWILVDACYLLMCWHASNLSLLFCQLCCFTVNANFANILARQQRVVGKSQGSLSQRHIAIWRRQPTCLGNCGGNCL